MSKYFDQCFAYSESPSVTRYAKQVMATRIPGLKSIERAHLKDDRRGVDYWVKTSGNNRIAVDLKARRTYPGWLFLELWSSMEDQVVGWTLRKDYLTDLVLWIWSEQKRFVLIPFKQLQKSFREFGRNWIATYQVRTQETAASSGRPGYHSQCVMVPVHTVLNAISQPLDERSPDADITCRRINPVLVSA